MSQLKVNTIRHTGASSDAVTLASDGTCTAKITNNLSNRNLIINGAMNVAQRATSVTGVTTSGYRTCDRMTLGNSSLGTWTVTQESDGPDGFSKSFKILCTTADNGSGNYACLFYHIEGQDLQQLAFGTSNAKAMVLSFWVKSNKTGNASVELQQRDNSDKQVTYSYNISSANTWEKKTISVPADTSGVINDDTGIGIRLGWWLNSGSAGSFTGGTHRSTWTAEVNADRNVTNIGIGGAVNDYLQITGIQLEIDSTGSGVATDFEHRSYGDELARCQRYFQIVGMGTSMSGDSNGATQVRGLTIPLVTSMRATPTIASGVTYHMWHGDNGGKNNDGTAMTVTAIGTTNFPSSAPALMGVLNGFTGNTDNRVVVAVPNTARMELSAEL